MRQPAVLHFSPSGDHRHHWGAFARRMNVSRGGVDEIARDLAEAVAHIAGADTAAVYLRGESSLDPCRLAASVGGVRFATSLDRDGALSQWVGTMTSPTYPPARLLAGLAPSGLPVALVVPLHWRATLIGFVALGPRSDSEDGVEDLECLTAVADQAAAAIMAVALSAAATRPNEIGTPPPRIAVAIHDIKNSVSALSMLARNAAAGISDPEFQRDTVTTLSRTVDRLRHLLDTLSTTCLQAPVSRSEPIDLHQLIIDATTALAAHGRVRLVRELGQVNGVQGDRDALLRVVENLATNAVEAIEREGTVTVTLTEAQGYAVISVADTGCGIAPEQREHHLFTPFHSTKQGGWGLGLYQTKQAVESQDGEIRVDSVVGQGTTFTVRLPLRVHPERSSLESVR